MLQNKTHSVTSTQSAGSRTECRQILLMRWRCAELAPLSTSSLRIAIDALSTTSEGLLWLLLEHILTSSGEAVTLATSSEEVLSIEDGLGLLSDDSLTGTRWNRPERLLECWLLSERCLSHDNWWRCDLSVSRRSTLEAVCHWDNSRHMRCRR